MRYVRLRERWSGPLVLAVVFTVAGLAWIFVSDWAVATFAPGTGPWLQTVKGTAFVLTGGVLLYVLTASFRKRERRRRRHFEALVENCPEMIAVLSTEGEIRYRSPGYIRVLGYSTEELESAAPFTWVHPDDVERVRAAFFDEPPAPYKTTSPIEFRMRGKDGSWRLCEGTALNLLDDPAVEGMVLNLRDVTSARATREQIERTQRLETIGQMASGIAHDFNNLLHVIKGFTEVVTESLADDDPNREHLNEVVWASKRGEAFASKLLALSRSQPVEPTDVDLNACMREMKGFLGHSLNSSIELRFELEEDLPTLHLDESQLEQVLLNLAVNARDAMPDGGALEIRTARRGLAVPALRRDYILPPGEYVFLRVADTGCGMDEETAARIFEPFFTTKDRDKGTGLGLATVMGIVKEWNGYIGVESAPEEGTTFEIAIPMTVTETAREIPGESFAEAI